MTGFEQSTSRFSTRRCLHGYYIYCSNPTNFFSSLSSCFGRFFCACGERDEFPGVYMITPPMYGEPLDPSPTITQGYPFNFDLVPSPTITQGYPFNFDLVPSPTITQGYPFNFDLVPSPTITQGYPFNYDLVPSPTITQGYPFNYDLVPSPTITKVPPGPWTYLSNAL
ncbi:hypothetical protein JTE90_019000 [Oedothorax gibbosus]|uniref:Uncharacterized protein n=1 Tax=Oedothorax gibbosus TaxID=931172 RepID=A0AAV6U5K6_9ARAC|nr:hypothetical protein JTE90_019000 [Oedothorax gibbosus]